MNLEEQRTAAERAADAFMHPTPPPHPNLSARQSQYLDLLLKEGSLMIGGHHPRIVQRTMESLVVKGIAARQPAGRGWTRYVPTIDFLSRQPRA